MYIVSDWFASNEIQLSNEILWMMIGSCVSQFTPKRGVILSRFLISNGGVSFRSLCSTSTLIFPRKLISLLFTSWHVSFTGLIISILNSARLFSMMLTGKPVSMVRFCLFSFRYRNDHCFPVVFCFFVLSSGILRVWFLLRHLLRACFSIVWLSAAHPCKRSYFLAIIVFYCFCRTMVSGSNFVVRRIRSRFSLVFSVVPGVVLLGLFGLVSVLLFCFLPVRVV